MHKLFIGYRSSDAAKVDKIARDLSLLRNDDGTARYTTWQDKHNLPPASPDWWDAIVDAIYASDMFVFNISKASLQSEVCRAELDYAHKLNLPIIPVVLEDEYFLDANSGKYNIDYWNLIPDWLGERQLLFYAGAKFFKDFEEAVAMFENSRPLRLNPKRPLNPNSKSVHGSNHARYDAACDYAERLAFVDAKRHFYNLVRRRDSDYGKVAALWLKLLGRYAELIEIDERHSTRFIFDNKWTAYLTLFPNEFLDHIFDPKGFATIDESARSARITRNYIPTVVLPTFAAPPRPTSMAILPDPFEWIDIPSKGYGIAKYPVTNAQFAKFIDAGGYEKRQWWTTAGWKVREEGWHYDGKWKASGKPWTEPRFWKDDDRNGTEQPVAGVSWYEAVAFCQWLSEVTREKIMLPTEVEWQYASQGDDGRTYPWGNQWDASLCNNNIDKNGIGMTTPVRQYEGKGDSPFGVVDMAGNVWEWCLTDFDNKTRNINNGNSKRVLRGGSCNIYLSNYFQCVNRVGYYPYNWYNSFGFRISRS